MVVAENWITLFVKQLQVCWLEILALGAFLLRLWVVLAIVLIRLWEVARCSG